MKIYITSGCLILAIMTTAISPGASENLSEAQVEKICTKFKATDPGKLDNEALLIAITARNKCGYRSTSDQDRCNHEESLIMDYNPLYNPRENLRKKICDLYSAIGPCFKKNCINYGTTEDVSNTRIFAAACNKCPDVFPDGSEDTPKTKDTFDLEGERQKAISMQKLCKLKATKSCQKQSGDVGSANTREQFCDAFSKLSPCLGDACQNFEDDLKTSVREITSACDSCSTLVVSGALTVASLLMSILRLLDV